MDNLSNSFFDMTYIVSFTSIRYNTDNYRVKPNDIYRFIHLSSLSMKILKKDLCIDNFRIEELSLINSKKFYRPNDLSHLSVSAGV